MNDYGYLLGVLGTWLLADAIYSLYCYWGKPGQSLWKDHSVRFVRGLIALLLMYIGQRILNA